MNEEIYLNRKPITDFTDEELNEIKQLIDDRELTYEDGEDKYTMTRYDIIDNYINFYGVLV